jgi:hypothetical protein
VVAGLIATFPANKAMTITPACALLQPKPTWKNSGGRNGTALITNRNSDRPLRSPGISRRAGCAGSAAAAR